MDLAGLGLSPKQIHLWGDEILAAVMRGTAAPLVKREQAQRPNDAMLKRLEKLKSWRKKIAEEMNVESDIILPKVLYVRIGRTSPREFRRIGSR